MRGSSAKLLSRYATAARLGEGGKKVLKKRYLRTPGPKRRAFKDRMKREMSVAEAPADTNKGGENAVSQNRQG